MTTTTITSVRDLADAVRAAFDDGAPLRITTCGTWPESLRSVRSGATTLDCSAITGIVEYIPGDLTLTARAGTTLAELEEATARHGQWCPLSPWGTDAGSFGATMATATRGPLTTALGAPRDLALGIECVDGTGAVIRGGGRVVKNVAGFDLTRLMVGSWGTLAILTEISVRLRARPAVDETWSVPLDGDGVTERLHVLRQGVYAPLACEMFHGAAARAVGLSADAALVRLGGNAGFVAAARSALRTASTNAAPHDPAVWTRAREVHAAPVLQTLAGAIDRPLDRRVKAQFDPRHILNPGLFAESA